MNISIFNIISEQNLTIYQLGDGFTEGKSSTTNSQNLPNYLKQQYFILENRSSGKLDLFNDADLSFFNISLALN